MRINAFVLLAFLSSLALNACNGAPPLDFTRPEILRNLSGTVEQKQDEIARRVVAKLGRGTPEPEFMAGLEDLGFTISEQTKNMPDIDAYGKPALKTAYYRGTSFPCDYYWDVRWTSKDKKAENVFAIIGSACP